jgi:hypothetical protein
MTNWYYGWASILTAFVTGAVIGLFFHRDDFLGGYGSFRRRILRLGHIALAALGMINILFGLSYPASQPSMPAQVASISFVVGGIAMPAVCFLSAWRVGFRHLFFIPVTALVIAAIETLRMGPP